MNKQKLILKVLGLSYAQLAEKLAKLETREGVKVGFSEKYLDCRIEIICDVDDDIAFYQTIESVRRIFAKDDLYAEQDILPEQYVVSVLTDRGKRVSVAESVTGGLIASKIVSVSGASAVFYEGLITYDSNAKVRRLHVPSSVIEEFGVVSEEVCRAMTFGLLSFKTADYVIASTGCAGPDSDEFGTPVGRVFLGSANASKKINIVKADFKGDRNTIRECAANAALQTLIKLIKSEE